MKTEYTMYHEKGSTSLRQQWLFWLSLILIIFMNSSLIGFAQDEMDLPEDDETQARCGSNSLVSLDLDSGISGSTGEIKSQIDNIVMADGIIDTVASTAGSPTPAPTATSTATPQPISTTVAPDLTTEDVIDDVYDQNNVDSTSIVILIVDDFTTHVEDAQWTHGAYVDDIVSEVVSVSGTSNVQIVHIDLADPNPGAEITAEPNTLLRVVQELNPWLNPDADNYINDFDITIVNMSWFILKCRGSVPFYRFFEGEFETPVEQDIFIDIPLFYKILQNDLSICLESSEPGICGEIAEELSSYDVEFERFLDGYIYLTDEDEGGAGIPSLNMVEIMLILSDGLIIPEDEIDLEEPSLVAQTNWLNYLSIQLSLADFIKETGSSSSDMPSGEIDLLHEWFAQQNIIPLAAAGNFNITEEKAQELGIDFVLADELQGNATMDRSAFAPASWHEVLAVGGTVVLDVDGNGLADKWSPAQIGQIAAPAAWYRFGSSQFEYGSGTSFATPLVSGLFALVGTTGCDLNTMVDPAAPLPYNSESYITVIPNHC